jgi:hypothetical protein
MPTRTVLKSAAVALVLSAAARTAEAQCPVGWSPFGSSCYTFLQTIRTWQDQRTAAMTAASAAGLIGSLVSINNGPENTFVFNTFGGNYWIGLNDLAVEGTYVREDGTILNLADPTQNFFGAGEPNNSGNEDCVHMRSDPRWNDLNCGNTLAGVVEAQAIAAVPEPAAVALLGSGLVGLGAIVRRRRV